MGNCNFKTEATEKSSGNDKPLSQLLRFYLTSSPSPSTIALSINNFTFHYVIGKGGFGKVNNYQNYFIITHIMHKKVNFSQSHKQPNHYLSLPTLN